MKKREKPVENWMSYDDMLKKKKQDEEKKKRSENEQLRKVFKGEQK